MYVNKFKWPAFWPLYYKKKVLKKKMLQKQNNKKYQNQRYVYYVVKILN